MYLENKKASGEITSSYTYTLDAVSNRKKVEEHDGRKVEYTYDDLYRLTNEQITDSPNGNRTYEYQYDRVGNRKEKKETVNGTTTVTTQVSDNNDRLSSKTTNGVVTSYAYDDDGNTINRTLGTEQTVYGERFFSGEVE